jgi:hypothetical protein
LPANGADSGSSYVACGFFDFDELDALEEAKAEAELLHGSRP